MYVCLTCYSDYDDWSDFRFNDLYQFLSYMVLTIYIYNKYNHIYKTAFKEIIKFALLKKILLLSVFVVITNYITGTLLKILGVRYS